MRILKVIHGYPPRYSAGSEVYSRLLAHELANNHDVQVFTRQENSFLPDYQTNTELDDLDPRILIHLINVPRTKYVYQYIHQAVEEYFSNILSDFKPHIIHFGHLNHLSIRLPEIAKNDLHCLNFMTLHDYWLLCPRGQFIQRNSVEPWDFCQGQNNYKCATQCYKGRISGNNSTYEQEIIDQELWVANRMVATEKVIDSIDQFISPSKYLMEKFYQKYKGKIRDKISYVDYGFNLKNLSKRKRNKEKELVFGYIGTHTPQKGVHDLLKAFSMLKKKNIKLKIWGYTREDTSSLHMIESKLDSPNPIEWCNGYQNEKIVSEVFNKIDVLVVPSIWEENSPLVIHEAQQVRIPVITANKGGMKEYVNHMENGLLFKFRDITDLSVQMNKFAEDPKLVNQLGKRGYLYSHDGDIPDITNHTQNIVDTYQEVAEKKKFSLPPKPGPWRITFDTNPDHCNYKCVMCECFSPYSDVKDKRKALKIKKRVMPIETIEKIIKDSVGTPLREIIPSTMGEPLLYKDFDRIIELCHEYNLRLNLTTNGSFPIKGAKAWSQLLVPICSDIKISINGSSKEVNDKIMLYSDWDQMLSNIKELVKQRDNYYAHSKIDRCNLTFQVTFLQNNAEDFPELLKLALELGIDRIKGHHLWAHFDEIKSLSMRRNKTAISQWNAIVDKLYEIRDKSLLPNGKKIKLENFHHLDVEAVTDIAKGGYCPFLGKEAWINTEGVFSPCCAPDDLRKSLGDFGSINNQTIEDIWTSKQYQQLSKNYHKYDLCKNCNMRKPLEG